MSLSKGSQNSYVGFDRRLTVGSPSLDYRSKLLRLVSVLVVLLTLGVGSALGTTVSWTASSGALGSNTVTTSVNATGTISTGSFSWDYTRSFASRADNKNDHVSWQNTNGYIQLGSSNFRENVSFTTSAFSGKTIESISVNCASASGSHTLTIDVGGTKYLDAVSTPSWSSYNGGTKTGPSSGTGSSSGDITITFTAGTGAVYIKSISVTYSTTPAAAYTVTYNAGTGSCKASEKEASAGAGVTLPTPTHSCSSDGWAFYGWKTGSLVTSETSTAPAIVGKGGDTYYPTGDVTLYAVYAKGEYTKETSSITSGSKYLIVGASGGHNYIMKSSSDDMHDYSGYTGMAATQIDETSSGKYHAAAVDASWCYTISGSVGAYYIRDVVNESSSNYLDLYFTSFWGKSYYSEDSYTMTVSSGEWTIEHNDVSNTYLGLDGSDEAFFIYTSAQNILLYKAGTISYYSSPTCCTQLGTINGSIF